MADDSNYSPSKKKIVNSNADPERSYSADSVSSKGENSGGTRVSPIKRSRTGTGGSGNNQKERRSGGYQKRGSGGGEGTSGLGKDNKRATPTGTETSVTSGGGSNNTVGGGYSKSGQTSSGNSKKKYSVRKRAPPREDFDVKPNDVFVNEKSHFVGQLSKCRKLFSNGHREVYLHGLGKAIPRAVNLAFELRKLYHNTVDYTVNTSTVQVFDDLIDIEDPEQPPSVRTRNVSSVNIRVFRSVNIP